MDFHTPNLCHKSRPLEPRHARGGAAPVRKPKNVKTRNGATAAANPQPTPYLNVKRIEFISLET